MTEKTVEQLQVELDALKKQRLEEELAMEREKIAKQTEELRKKAIDEFAKQITERVQSNMGYKAESKMADDKTGIALTGNAIVDQTRRTFILKRQREGKKYEGETYEQMLKKRVDGDY